jgi:hypothetical protein
MGYGQDLSRSVGDVESEVPMSPLSVVHVRQDFEVTRVDASQHTLFGFIQNVFVRIPVSGSCIGALILGDDEELAERCDTGYNYRYQLRVSFKTRTR